MYTWLLIVYIKRDFILVGWQGQKGVTSIRGGNMHSTPVN